MLKLSIVFLLLSISSAYSTVTKQQLVSFADKYMQAHNLSTLKKDNIFSSYKRIDSSDSFTIEAYRGPENFKQVAIWCDQCSRVISFTDQKILACNDFIKKFYAHLGQDQNRNFEKDLRNSQMDKNIYIKPDEKFKLRLTSGRLKCDDQGPGTRIRIDFFSK